MATIEQWNNLMAELTDLKEELFTEMVQKGSLIASFRSGTYSPRTTLWGEDSVVIYSDGTMKTTGCFFRTEIKSADAFIYEFNTKMFFKYVNEVRSIFDEMYEENQKFLLSCKEGINTEES